MSIVNTNCQININIAKLTNYVPGPGYACHGPNSAEEVFDEHIKPHLDVSKGKCLILDFREIYGCHFHFPEVLFKCLIINYKQSSNLGIQSDFDRESMELITLYKRLCMDFNKRIVDLEKDPSLPLSPLEIKYGVHRCQDWDGMVLWPWMEPELSCCLCNRSTIS